VFLTSLQRVVPLSGAEETPQKMDDPDKLRLQYKIAVLQHQQNLMELALHEIRVIRRRRGQRKYWVRNRRRQFDLYDQLRVELRNEDQQAFKNFMRMPPPTRVGPRISKGRPSTLA